MVGEERRPRGVAFDRVAAYERPEYLLSNTNLAVNWPLRIDARATNVNVEHRRMRKVRAPAPQLPRVAVIAFTTQPGLGSEYEVGWRWALLAGQAARAVVLTRRECFEAIPGRARQVGGIRAKRSHGATFVAVDLPFAPALFPHRRLTRTHYLFWQVLVLAWLRRHRRSFDFAHHVNFVAAWFPPFAAFSTLPLLWGPVGTNPPIPSAYLEMFGLAGKAKALLRRFVTVELVRNNPLLHLAAPRITRAFAITEYVRSLLPARLQLRTDIHPAIALDGTWGTGLTAAGGASDLILFVGRAIDVKLPRLAFDAAARAIAIRGKGEALLIGEHLSRFLADAPPAPGVTVRDSVTQDELREIYATAGIFLFPSLESSGFVTLEAMANGLPVVTLTGTGAELFAGSEAGIAITPPSSYREAVEALATAVVALLDDPIGRARMADAARERVAQFEWTRYLPFVQEIYADLAGSARG